MDQVDLRGAHTVHAVWLQILVFLHVYNIQFVNRARTAAVGL